MTKLRIGTLLVTLVAMLALASTAMAKGGGGGGGGGGGEATCAQIVDFAVTPGSTDGQPTLTTSYTVDNRCFDLHKSSAAALDYSNSANSLDSFPLRAVWMLPLGPTSYTSNALPVTPGVTYTTTLTVYATNGKVAGTRTITVTAPLA